MGTLDQLTASPSYLPYATERRWGQGSPKAMSESELALDAIVARWHQRQANRFVEERTVRTFRFMNYTKFGT